MSQEIAVIASGPPMTTEAPLDFAAGPSTSTHSSSDGDGADASSSVAIIEREYVIQPNTIIELVDLYVPPVRTEFRIPTFQPPPEVPALNRDGAAQGIRGRRRGRPPLGSRPSGVSVRKPYKRRSRQESPPPLPPVPNYLSHVINPLENEIYPKVIVQPARQPYVMPKNLSKNPTAPSVPSAPLAPSAPPIKPQPRDTAKEAAQLRANLKLFGPNVTISQVTCHGQTRFLAVQKKPNGEQRKILFSAGQLQAFVASCRATLMFNRGGGVSWPKLLPPSVTRLRPGPAPRRLIEPPVPQPPMPPPPPAQPPRVIVEPPPNFRLPTMAALRAAALNARQAGSAGGGGGGPAAGPLSLGERVGFEVGVEVGVGGKPVVRPTQHVVKVPADVWVKPKVEQKKPAAVRETAVVAAPAPAQAPASSTSTQAQARIPVQALPPRETLPSLQSSNPFQTLPPAKAMPPSLPRPTSLELSRSRVPSILTRKSQLRLLNQRAKRAADREVEEAKKLRQDHKENYLLNILKHKIQKPLDS